MKQFIYLLLLICGTANAQIVNIPDTNFKNKLLSANTGNNVAKDQNGISIIIDTNGDNQIQLSEALTVYELNVINSGIDDLTGIEAFTNLTDLECDQNNLDFLDVTALSTLQNLTCSINNLNELDLSENPNLEFLWALNNPLTFVNVKNGSAFDPEQIGSGTWLEMWANLPDDCYVCADESEIEDIEEFLNFFGSGKHVTSYCTITPGGDYNTITGKLLFDVDNDGSCDGIEFPQPYLRVDITDGTETGASFTNEDGEYYFYTLAGSFTLTPNFENVDFFTITPADATVTFPIVDNSVEVVNFCITADGVHPDLEIVIAPLLSARPGFEATYKILYRNKGNQTLSQTNGVNFFYQDNFMDFVSATETPDSQAEGLLSWDYVDLLPFEERSIVVTMDINSPSDTDPVNIDDVLLFEAIIQPLAGDETIEDNNYILSQVVVGAYDPNDIICLEGDIEDPVNIGEQLHYRIRFENTGNFPAENVVVVMEIDPEQFDAATLLLLNASHEVEARLRGNLVEFFFQDIQLASGGHGNILLAMETLQTLQEGDAVMNQADIYFDYNFPVTTNEATTVFETIMSTQDPELSSSVTMFPNPARESIHIQATISMTSIEWYDVAGRLLHIHLVNDNQTTLDITARPPGVYFLKVNTPEGSIVKKVIKN